MSMMTDWFDTMFGNHEREYSTDDVYVKRNDKGEVVDTKVLKEGSDEWTQARNARNASENGTAVLLTKDGEWKPVTGSITYDKNTGKIKVTAPKEVLASDWFKSQYKDGEVFNQVAKMFKNDPDGKTTVKYTDKDGNIVEKKISDWLDEESKALNTYAGKYMNQVVPIRNQILEMTNGGITMSDKLIGISQSAINRNDYRWDEDTVVYLPSSILRLGHGAFQKMGSWNEETQTVNAKDFYDWYDLDDDKGKDFIEMEKVLNWELARLSGAEEYGEADPEQLARVISFYKTLKNDDPEANFIQGAGLFLESFEQGFKKVLVDGSINLYNFFEDVGVSVATATSLNTDSGKALAVLTLGGSLGVNAVASASVGMTEGQKTSITNIGEFIAGIDGTPSEQGAVEGFIAMADITKGLMEGKGFDTINHWSKQTNTPTNLEALKTVDSIYDKKLTSLAEISGAANAGRIIGTFAGEIVKQVAITNVIGTALGGVVKGAVTAGAKAAYTAFNFGNDIKGLTSALEMGLKTYLKTATLAESTVAFAKATEIVAGSLGMATNLLAQGMVDTVLNDEEFIHNMLTNPDAHTASIAYDALVKNVGYNIFGEVSGFGISLGGKAKRGAVKWVTENTLWGATLDASAIRTISYAAGKKHTTLAKFAEWMSSGQSKAAKFFDKIFKASDEASKWFSDLHWREAEAYFNIAHAAEGIDTTTKEGMKAANEATQKAVFDRMVLEVSMNRVTRGIMREWQALVKNPAIAKEYGEFNEAMTKLLRAEGAKVTKAGTGSFMSQETADYIALRSILDRLANKKTLTKAEEAYQSALKDRVAKYTDTHSAEVKAAADEVLQSFRKYEKAYMDFAMKVGDDGGLGLYDAKEVLGWRKTGYWGKNGDQYIPLVKLEGEEGGLAAAKRSSEYWAKGGNYKAKLSVDEYELKPGDADAHYLDPSLAMYTQQVTAAKVIAARDWGDALMKNDALAKEIDMNGMPVTNRDVKKARAEIRNVVSKTFEDFRASDTVLQYGFANAFNRGTAATVTRKANKVKRIIGLSTPEDYTRSAYGFDEEDIINLGKKGYKIPGFEKFRNKYQLQKFYDSLSKADKKIVDKALGTEPLSVKNYNKALDSTDLRLKLQRKYIADNIANGKHNASFKKYVEQQKILSLKADARTKFTKAFEDWTDAMKQAGLRVKGKDDFTKMMHGFLEDVCATATKSLDENPFFSQMIKKYAEEGVPADVAKRYLVLQELQNYFAEGTSKKAYQQMIAKNLDNLDVSGNLTTRGKLKAKQAINEGLEDAIDTEWKKSVKALKSSGGEELLDSQKVFDYIYKQMSDFVDTTVKSPNVIQVLDKNGQFHLYEVSPTTANLYTTRPNLNSYKKKGLSSFFNKTNRLARIGNVGWSLKSFMNQWVRDPLNAFVMGGMVRTLGKNADAMGELLGPQVVQLMKEAMGEAGWKDFTAEIADKLGREATEEELATAAKEALTGNELKNMANQAVGDLGVETEYYRDLATGYKEKEWGQWEEEIGAMGKSMNWLEEHSLGNFREIYLRKGVYAQAFNDALSAGKTIAEAKVVAEYTMLNATTNFARAFAWGNNITTSVSFLGAAINGKASFWRLFELDPIGVSSRFINGLVIPMMALITQSVESKEDREIYESIPEYEKDDNIVFVVNGTKMKIPIPQELSAFLAPFRHTVEKCYDVNRHAWSELVWNDILGTSTIDLTGFVDLDANILTGDPTLADRINAEGQALISQLSPTIVKTAYMAITGIDPYTGNRIDTSSIRIDENGDVQIFDSKETGFTKWLSETLKGMGINLSASAAHALLQSFFGSGGVGVMDMVSDLFSDKSLEEKANFALESTVGQAVSAFQSKSANDAASYAWKEAVKELKVEKDALLDSKEYETIAQGLANLDSTKADYEQKRKKLLQQYNELVQGYQQKVYNAVKRVQSVYGSDYDKERFAATISLLTFKKNFGMGLTEVEKEATKTLSYEATSRAKQTMAAWGFDSPTDLSIFGFMRTDEYGNTEMKMNNPVAILNLPSEVWGTTDNDIANFEAIFTEHDITRKDMFGDEYNKAKAAGKKALKQYKADWNAKVVKAIAPYMKEHGVLNVVENSRTMDELKRYIFVDNPYKAKESIIKLFGGK